MSWSSFQTFVHTYRSGLYRGGSLRLSLNNDEELRSLPVEELARKHITKASSSAKKMIVNSARYNMEQ
jgi:hypothetical protein